MLSPGTAAAAAVMQRPPELLPQLLDQVGILLRDLPDGVHVVRICDPTPVRQIVLRTRNGVRGVPVADRVMELLVAQANAMVGGADAGLR